MKKYLILFAFIIFIINTTYAQRWTYKSGGNAFDGKYKTSSIKGSGGEFPYTSPYFVVNYFENSEQLNIYVSNAGSAICDGKIVYMKFDNDEKLYQFKVSTNADEDLWFLEKYYNDESTLSKVELLNKLKSQNRIYVRLRSDCGQTDYEFSLAGSSAAINYVTAEYFNKLKQIELAKKKKEEEERKKSALNKIKKKQIIKMMEENEDKTFKGKARYFPSIHSAPKEGDFYGGLILQKGEDVLFKVLPNNEDFYIIIKSSSVELPNDTTLYINKKAISLLSIELANE